MSAPASSAPQASSHLFDTFARAPLAFERGEGAWLFTPEGEAYLDFSAGIAVNSLGHANPTLVAALTEQAGKLWHTSNLFRIPGVTLFDAAVRWDLGRQSPALKGVRLALNVANVSDKTYVATCLSSTGCYYGERRSVYFTAGYSW